MSKHSKRDSMKNFKLNLKKDLILKGFLIPLIFAVITVIVCLTLSNPQLEIFSNAQNVSENTQNAFVQSFCLGGFDK